MSPRSAASAHDVDSRLDGVFFALADSTRRALLTRLRGAEATAGDLAAGFAVTRPAVSRHLRVLRQAALVSEKRQGRQVVYCLGPQSLRLVTEWLEDYRVFWAARLHDLKSLVESMPELPAAAPVDPGGAPAGDRSRRQRPGKLVRRRG